VALSDYEKRALHEIEADLSAQDPPLAARLSALRGSRLRLWQVVVLSLVGLCVFAAGLALASGSGQALALGGYLMIVGSASWLVSTVCARLADRRRGTP
jgi:hypothetical protein